VCFCHIFFLLLLRSFQPVYFTLSQAAKRHLTQHIEKLDDKLDQQKALSGQIRDDVLFL
jgi:hypothetical protein